MPAPIDIAGPRTMQDPTAGEPSTAYPIPIRGNNSGMSGANNGIPINASKLRRESFAQSIGNGISWGGVSVGSWVRDDILMTGTSPFTQQTPSFHSSSYLPKLEASFFKDFSCCGRTLPSLHDLLQHYEECHAHQPPSTDDNSMHRIQQQQQADVSADMMHARSGFGAQMSGISGIGLGMMRQQQLAQQRLQEYHDSSHQDSQNHDRDDRDDGEAAGEMDLDTEDMTPPSNYPQAQTPKHPLQQQHLQMSNPNTPNAHRRLNHPNTPSLITTNMHSGQHVPLMNQFSPESSAPGTPHPMDANEFMFAPSGLASGMNMAYGAGPAAYHQGGGMVADPSGLNLDLCIDEPAKRLYSPNGLNGLTQAQMRQLRLELEQGMVGSNQMARYQGGMVGNAAANLQPPGYDDKPFKCPVIGCEKAYKNQNGLKYHKGHGHNNQQLQENADGTMSIVNPETSAPYPGTLGMEKEKPYKCDVCGKRYKNLNGLKYHRAHSPRCVMPGAVPPPPGAVVAVAGGVAGELV